MAFFTLVALARRRSSDTLFADQVYLGERLRRDRLQGGYIAGELQEQPVGAPGEEPAPAAGTPLYMF